MRSWMQARTVATLRERRTTAVARRDDDAARARAAGAQLAMGMRRTLPEDDMAAAGGVY
jgi:hypothetical protein